MHILHYTKSLSSSSSYYYNLAANISISNPISNNANSSPGVILRGYFYNSSNYNIVTQIPEYLLVSPYITYAPIDYATTGALFNNYSNIQFFNTNNNVLDIGVGNSSYYHTRYFYNNGSGKQFLGGIGMSGMGVALYSASDYRLKENVSPLENGLYKVNHLNPVTWTWKNTEIKSEGFIAHEVQDIIPIAVNGEKDKYDYDGNPQYQQIDTTKIIPTLVSAIKELSAEIDFLKMEILSLKGGLSDGL